jgi:hypothetical protein
VGWAEEEVSKAASVDFSAQFGGRDAAAAVLPHFKSLKKAARETTLADFPLPKLAFILRVDGEVNAYGFRGAANVDIDKKGGYVSVDIGIAVEDRHRIKSLIAEAIQSSVSLLTAYPDERLRNVDGDSLRNALRILCESYARHLAEARR